MPRAIDSGVEGMCVNPGLLSLQVNGKPVTAMLDTGSSLSMIRKDKVPTHCVDYSHQTLIKCVHGDQMNHPTAELTVKVKGPGTRA